MSLDLDMLRLEEDWKRKGRRQSWWYFPMNLPDGQKWINYANAAGFTIPVHFYYRFYLILTVIKIHTTEVLIYKSSFHWQCRVHHFEEREAETGSLSDLCRGFVGIIFEIGLEFWVHQKSDKGVTCSWHRCRYMKRSLIALRTCVYVSTVLKHQRSQFRVVPLAGRVQWRPLELCSLVRICFILEENFSKLVIVVVACFMETSVAIPVLDVH